MATDTRSRIGTNKINWQLIAAQLTKSLATCSNVIEKISVKTPDFLSSLEDASFAEHLYLNALTTKPDTRREIFQGHFKLGNECLEIEFDAPIGATMSERDAIFMGVLVQKAEVLYQSLRICQQA